MVHFLAQVLYDYIIVSTLDLIDYGFANRKEYVPVSGGTDFFYKIKRKKVSVSGRKQALSIDKDFNISRTRQLIKSNSIDTDLDAYDRTKKQKMYKEKIYQISFKILIHIRISDT